MDRWGSGLLQAAAMPLPLDLERAAPPLVPSSQAADAPVPVVLIGAGRWGTLHASKLAAMPGARLVAAVDLVPERARALAAAHPGCAALTDLRAISSLPTPPVAAVAAVPIGALATVAHDLLAAGLHVLVEKPGAASVAELRPLIALARQLRRVLVVGFVERFNPGVTPLCSGRRLVIRRMGPGRPGAAPLHLDWLVHDLDLARLLLGPGLRVERVTARRGPAAELRVHLSHPEGREALLHVVRGDVSPTRRLSLDGRRVSLLVRPPAPDPLTEQALAFFRAVRGGEAPRLAGADAALETLRLAEEVAMLARMASTETASLRAAG